MTPEGRPSGNLLLTLIVSRKDCRPRTPEELISLAAAGGVTAVQLREKEMSGRDFYELALTVGSLCRKLGLAFIINDRLDLALAAGADGLHLGREDLPLKAARKFWPSPKILGATAKTPEQARQAIEAGASYLGVGALFPSPTKPSALPMAPETAAAIRDLSPIPLIGIGGLTPDRAAQAWALGLDGLAVSSALTKASDPAEAARRILSAKP
ncbi:MAG: thiamine phosphate synthase [Deltaproteobacteria bacterium]|jgi:thiamine-phosphate pyrophosphorylase|nr:thiamine phosphate synthase [Deltaproteobacteria bacterium]